MKYACPLRECMVTHAQNIHHSKSKMADGGRHDRDSIPFILTVEEFYNFLLQGPPKRRNKPVMALLVNIKAAQKILNYLFQGY